MAARLSPLQQTAEYVFFLFIRTHTHTHGRNDGLIARTACTKRLGARGVPPFIALPPNGPSLSISFHRRAAQVAELLQAVPAAQALNRDQ